MWSSAAVDSVAARLVAQGFVRLRGIHDGAASAWHAATAVFAACAPHDRIGADMPDLEAVGEFTVPPLGAPRRGFQALHIDFGLPIGPRRAADVARFPALYIERDRLSASAQTRVVPLGGL